MEWFSELNPLLQGLLATTFTWHYSSWSWASILFKSVDKRILNTMIGFGAGVMIAASFWSLLSPAITYVKN